MDETIWAKIDQKLTKISLQARALDVEMQKIKLSYYTTHYLV